VVVGAVGVGVGVAAGAGVVTGGADVHATMDRRTIRRNDIAFMKEFPR
jgi:hypothetical protein